MFDNFAQRRYRARVMRKTMLVLLAACMLLAACKQISEKENEKEIILRALKQYIDQQPGFEPNTAKRSIRTFNVDRDRATVIVEFTSRTDSSVRLMEYNVRRENAVWVVKEAKPYTPRPV